MGVNYKCDLVHKGKETYKVRLVITNTTTGQIKFSDELSIPATGMIPENIKQKIRGSLSTHEFINAISALKNFVTSIP